LAVINRREFSVFCARSFFWPVLAVLALVVSAAPFFAQSTSYPIEGFICRIDSPTSFLVDESHFEITPQTAFGYIESDSTSVKSPLRDALRIGAYVQVAGKEPYPGSPVIATTVLVSDDRNVKPSGIGVITRVLAAAPDAVFEADGYLIRIQPSTKLSFDEGLVVLDDVSTNAWIRFSGKLGKDGVIEADKAHFMPAKPTAFKAVKHLEVPTVKIRPADAKDDSTTSAAKGTPPIASDGASLQQDEQLKIGPGNWQLIPADQPLQQRIHRIGIALVPAYQRDLADDDPSKIHFRFFAVDSKSRRPACLLDGAILIPTTVVERLKNDDQMAAVLADCVAYSLQRQAARQIELNRALWGMAAGQLAGAFVPGLGTVSALAGTAAAKRDDYFLLGERRRMALAVMHDAGFDPWQAPEAWRLLEPKKLPAHLATLAYPEISCFQFNVLNLQYARK
jgi:hypothetical protein